MTAPSDRAAHPLERAVELARELRITFDASPAELGWLLGRWRDVQGLPLRNDVLALVVQMLFRDAPPPPLTVGEAREIARAAAEDFDLRDDARRAAHGYGLARGATAEQLLRLDQLVYSAWAERHGEEVARAA